MLRVGVDVGGTNTDAVLLRTCAGRAELLASAKVPPFASCSRNASAYRCCFGMRHKKTSSRIARLMRLRVSLHERRAFPSGTLGKSPKMN
eukprot:8211861-Pyramimonas_sp.AAC.1